MAFDSALGAFGGYVGPRTAAKPWYLPRPGHVFNVHLSWRSK
jgi:hypothetical protein